jgi:hypothetical protein
MKYQYGELFKRLEIPGMGHQGATWCALNPEGVLVLMAHQNYFFRRKTGKWQYEMPADEPKTPRGPSARRSLDMIAGYFADDKKIILAVAVFLTDGALRSDGTWGPSKFDHATGEYYEGRMRQFQRESGYLLCDVDINSKRAV